MLWIVYKTCRALCQLFVRSSLRWFKKWMYMQNLWTFSMLSNLWRIKWRRLILTKYHPVYHFHLSRYLKLQPINLRILIHNLIPLNPYLLIHRCHRLIKVVIIIIMVTVVDLCWRFQVKKLIITTLIIITILPLRIHPSCPVEAIILISSIIAQDRRKHWVIVVLIIYLLQLLL